MPRRRTFVQPIEPVVKYNRPVFETLGEVKRANAQSVLMRPTLNSRGRFVNRSICGSPKVLETTLQHKDTYRKDYADLKQLLLKAQIEKNKKFADTVSHIGDKMRGMVKTAISTKNAPSPFEIKKIQRIETNRKQ